MKALNGNMVTHILLIEAVIDGMIGQALSPHRRHHLGDGEVALSNLGLSNGAGRG